MEFAVWIDFDEWTAHLWIGGQFAFLTSLQVAPSEVS